MSNMYVCINKQVGKTGRGGGGGGSRRMLPQEIFRN